MSSYNVKNYTEQGGENTVIGGSIDVTGTLKKDGIAITASATEINALDDILASVAELNLIDGSIIGTAVAKKVLALGTNKNVDEFHTAALYLGADAGTQVVASAAELNLLDTSVPGTAVALKALALGTGALVDTLDITTLKIGGIAITATATEINLIDGSIPGTAVALKALAVGTNQVVDNLDITSLEIGGIAITANATEINLIDGSIPGQAVALKVLALGTAQLVDTLDITTLKIGGIAITVSATQLNTPISGVIASAAELNILDDATLTTKQLNAAPVHFLNYQVEALGAAVGITDRVLYQVPSGYKYTLLDAMILSQGSASVSAGYASVITIQNDADAIASKSLEASWPTAGNVTNLGALSATEKILTAASCLKLSIANTTDVTTPAFVLQVHGTFETV